MAETVLMALAKFFDAMDNVFAIVFFIALLLSFLDGGKKKKSPGAPPLPTPDIDIPTLANDPNIAVQQEVTVEPPPKIVPRGVTNNVTEAYRQKYKRQRQAEERSIRMEEHKLKSSSEERAEAVLDADDALNAMILKEIFDKPKALRRL